MVLKKPRNGAVLCRLRGRAGARQKGDQEENDPTAPRGKKEKEKKKKQGKKCEEKNKGCYPLGGIRQKEQGKCIRNYPPPVILPQWEKIAQPRKEVDGGRRFDAAISAGREKNGRKQEIGQRPEKQDNDLSFVGDGACRVKQKPCRHGRKRRAGLLCQEEAEKMPALMQKDCR